MSSIRCKSGSNEGHAFVVFEYSRDTFGQLDPIQLYHTTNKGGSEIGKYVIR